MKKTSALWLEQDERPLPHYWLVAPNFWILITEAKGAWAIAKERIT
jgi:hypothetical protein